MADRLTRRARIGTSATGAALSNIQRISAGQDQHLDSAVVELERNVPVVDKVDVVVCGGGPAARVGVSVRIFEAHECLGDIWTSGMLSLVIEPNKPGINAELIRRLDAQDARRTTAGSYVCDVEAMKLVLVNYCREHRIQVQCHTRIVAVEKDEHNRVRGVVSESKSGQQAWRVEAIIDVTGDGGVGALAGCQWEFGREKECPRQPMSLMGVITARPNALGEFDAAADPKNRERLRAEIQRAGMEPTYGLPTLWYMGRHVAAVMIKREYGIRPFDAAAVTEATMKARRELNDIVHALRKFGGIWDRCALVTTAEQFGVRDGRRIKGRYFVTVNDLTQGAGHKDAICRSAFPVDIHATMEEDEHHPFTTGGIKVKPYGIPQRALMAKDVDGLLMAGRCISGDFLAHASYRVTGNAVAMGEAAGIAAAIASKQKLLPHEVSWTQISSELSKLRS